MASALCSTRVAAPKSVAVSRRQQAVVCAAVPQPEEQPRRAVLGLMAAAVLSLGASAAQATVVAPKSSSSATMEGYNMEGTKKQGISAKRRKALLSKLRADADKATK